MDYRDIIESRYNREAWQQLLHDIFRSKVSFWREPSVVHASSRLAKQALNLGKISLADGESIAIYEVELTDNVDIERNRRGIRDMLTTDWRNMGYAGAFMFCYRQNESVLRFSYVSESWSFADDGTYKKESTDTRRFTYLLGEGHRSRTAIQQFEGLKNSNLSLKDLTKAFSVDAVSDMFFEDYKQQYEDIIAFITGKRMVKVSNKWEERVVGEPNETIFSEFHVFADPEKAIRDYVKKLMGRLVFLQFLQKKGWLGVPVNANWGDGDSEFIQHIFEKTPDKDHFVDNVLEPLFNDINSKRDCDIASSAVGKNIRVPYLNGGLFEPDAADAVDFPLPAKYMKSMLDFFASYNFTIDENDPDDAEMGVDPEMLGRIFENLLEDNKDKGAFYTPKEIVGYMCRESLIAYLQTDITDEVQRDAIRQFVTTHKQVENLPENILQKLLSVKICDPAIGSGAFPMGLLKELYLSRATLEGFDQKKAAEIKKHIIQHNIYGVDIERGAVDTARLRFWLALIVDEETPEALPNLDFKVMQGNSLLEQYQGTDLSIMTKKKTDISGVLSIYDDMLDVFRKELRDLLSQYFNCSDHSTKVDLRKRIISNVKKQLVEQGIDSDFGELDLTENDQFFMWNTWFYNVFSNGGFDIVIGNPPYGANIDELVDIYKKMYPNTSHGFKDIYKYFYDFGIKILKTNGIISYITPNTFLRQPRYKDLRKVLLKTNILYLLDLGENVFVDAVVPVAVLIAKKNNDYSVLNMIDLTSELTESNRDIIIKPLKFKQVNQSIWNETESNIFITTVREKNSNEYSLNEIISFKDAGINYQRVNVGLSQKGKSTLSKRLLYEGEQENNSDVEFWKGVDINEFFISDHTSRYCRPNIELMDNERVILNSDYFSISPKLIWRQTAPYPICAIDYKGIWFGRSIQAGIIKPSFVNLVSYEYLCGLLNSRFLRNLYDLSVKEGGRVFPQVKLEKLKPLPIRIGSKDQVSEVENIVKSLIQLKKQDIQCENLIEDLNLIVSRIYED